MNFGIPFIVISFSTWFQHVVKKYHLDDTFQKEMILVSQEIKCDKPSQEVYEALCKSVHSAVGNHIQKNQILFIDDKKENVEAAKRFGLYGITFDRLRQPASELIQELKVYGVEIE